MTTKAFEEIWTEEWEKMRTPVALLTRQSPTGSHPEDMHAAIHQRLRAARCLLTSSGGACDGRAETANVDATFLATSVLYNDYDGSIDPKVIAAAIQSKYPDARLALVNLHIDENAHEPAVYADAYSRAVALLEATMVRRLGVSIVSVHCGDAEFPAPGVPTLQARAKYAIRQAGRHVSKQLAAQKVMLLERKEGATASQELLAVSSGVSPGTASRSGAAALPPAVDVPELAVLYHNVSKRDRHAMGEQSLALAGRGVAAIPDDLGDLLAWDTTRGAAGHQLSVQLAGVYQQYCKCPLRMQVEVVEMPDDVLRLTQPGVAGAQARVTAEQAAQLGVRTHGAAGQRRHGKAVVAEGMVAAQRAAGAAGGAPAGGGAPAAGSAGPSTGPALKKRGRPAAGGGGAQAAGVKKQRSARGKAISDEEEEWEEGAEGE